ncbi:Putative N-acetylmannosaminyltransferase [Pelagimonas phthalicica]|uniref:Putative N-acetylmannosaminyltransferase n=1 Tax=Pelagimonas phthalicica TaxID=1037362 RepID=A0A238J6S0_9RHOB|nr:WecB/TagA/CpsF family glycosyltransferase [Pelagimonas phthalicica]TDS95023.1 exopolysaccharide biosynthesis WecB/TagA/CpsF family protein [Pelagimonas phthalicica]SMX26451.1 Putative N-acetylmannosaminyltransferase [Pelagimonas phthalicica]
MQFEFNGRDIDVNVPNWAVLEARVTERLAQRKGFALATINLDHLVKLAESTEFQAAYAAQDFVCADGNPIVWLSHLAGRPVSLIPGSEAILPLARLAAKQGVGVALVGSTEPVLAAATAYLEREVRDIEIVCCIAPPMGFDPKGAEAEEILAKIADSGARMCFVAMGAPRQEEFAALGRRKTPEVGFVSIGAGLDFFAGTQKRAPQWARKLQIEWLWRMMSNPKRLAMRYLKCMLILPGHVIRALWLRFRGQDQS